MSISDKVVIIQNVINVGLKILSILDKVIDYVLDLIQAPSEV